MIWVGVLGLGLGFDVECSILERRANPMIVSVFAVLKEDLRMSSTGTWGGQGQGQGGEGAGEWRHVTRVTTVKGIVAHP